MRSFDGKDPFDLALAHGQEAFCAFLDHARLSAGTTLPAEYARDEHDLVWKQSAAGPSRKVSSNLFANLFQEDSDAENGNADE